MEPLSVNEIAKRLLESLPSAMRGAQVDLENNFRAVLRNTLTKLDLVSREEFDNLSPATGLVLGRTSAAGTHDMDRAIAAARRAFDASDWSTNRALRRRCLDQLQNAIESDIENLREEHVAGRVARRITMERRHAVLDPRHRVVSAHLLPSRER